MKTLKLNFLSFYLFFFCNLQPDIYKAYQRSDDQRTILFVSFNTIICLALYYSSVSVVIFKMTLHLIIFLLKHEHLIVFSVIKI